LGCVNCTLQLSPYNIQIFPCLSQVILLDISFWYTGLTKTRLAEISMAVAEQISWGIIILRSGGVVAFPTDTVYGLGCDAFNKQAVDRVYQIKRRSRDIPFPLLLSDIHQVTEVAESVPEIAWILMKCFLPGGLTFILHKATNLPDFLNPEGDTVALRIPNHPVTLALIQGLGRPLIGTSANISGQPSPVTAEETKAQLGTKVDLIIDGGRCPGGIESTVIDVTLGMPKILRRGLIKSEEINKVLAEYGKRGDR